MNLRVLFEWFSENSVVLNGISYNEANLAYTHIVIIGKVIQFAFPF